MITFTDGPAKGQTLMLKRLPILLRVVKSRNGEWDALDQLDDMPAADEEISVYRVLPDPRPSNFHVLCGRGKRNASGWYWTASYQHLGPEEPPDEDLRETARWEKFCHCHWESLPEALRDAIRQVLLTSPAKEPDHA